MQKDAASRLNTVSRPVIAIMVVAMLSMSALSALLVYTSLQNTESRLDLATVQNLRQGMAEDTEKASNDIASDLQKLSNRLAAAAGAIEDAETGAQVESILDLAKVGREDYLHSMILVDQQGVLQYTTDESASGEIGSDHSGYEYYMVVSLSNRPEISGPFTMANGNRAVSVAVPLSAQGGFDGVLVAMIDAGILLQEVTDIFADDSLDGISMVEKTGLVLVHSENGLVGKNISDSEFQDMFADSSADIVNANLDLLKQGRSGVFEYYQSGSTERSLMAYSPVEFGGSHVWTIAASTPVTSAGDFSPALQDQRLYTVVAVVLIAIVAAIFIAFILIINKKLHETVTLQESRISGQLDDLKSAFDKLKEQDVIKDEFINVAAHELRTPVLPIILSAEGLAEELGTDNAKVDIILRNAKRINKLTNDILDVSRIESNTFRLQKATVNVKKLIEETIQDAQIKVSEAKSSKVKAISNVLLPEGKHNIALDRGRINQVLSNLLDNAFNFTESGTITTTLQESKDYPGFAEVRISDTGKGIDPSIKGRLFEKFATKSDQAKGTGLGLYLCKAIIESHGGKIWGENIPDGKGAVFAFTLPMREN